MTALNSLPSLVLNQAREASLAEAETPSFALHLESNKFATLVLEQKGVDLTLAVDDAKTGSRVLEINAYDSLFGSERIFLSAESAPRDFLVRVFSAEKKSGKFALTLTELKATDDGDKLRLAALSQVLDAQASFNENKAESKVKGRELLENALKKARQSGDWMLEKDILIALQSTSFHLGDYAKTIEYGQTALNLLNNQKPTYDQTLLKTVNGLTLITMNENRRGVEVLSETLVELQKIGDVPLQAACLNFMSDAYQRMGDFDKSLASAEQGYQLGKQANNITYQSGALRSMARIYFLRSDFSKASDVLNRALVLTKDEKDANDKYIVYYDLALNLISLGQFQKALGYLQESLIFYRGASGNKWNEAATLQMISSVYSSLGQYSRSLEYSQQATEIYQNFNYKSGLIGLAQTQAANYRKAGDYEKEKQSHLELLKLTEKDGPVEVTAEAYLKLGNIEKEQGNFDASLEYYAKSRQTNDRTGSKMIGTIAASGMSDAYILAGKFDQAAVVAEEARRVANSTGDRATESNALYDLARIRRHSGNLAESLSLIEDSLKIAESLRSLILNQESRVGYFSTIRRKYDFYIELLNQLENQEPGKGYGARAFAVSEKSRSRGLLDLLAESTVDISGGSNSELKTREQNNNAKLSSLQTRLIKLKSKETPDQTSIAKLEKEIDQIDDEREQLESEIRRSNPRYAALKYPTTLDLKQTQQLLDDKTVLLEYHVSKYASYLFAVTKNDLQIVPLPNEQALRDSVELLHRSVSQPARAGLATYTLKARDLYKTLLAPLENTLKTKSKLIISGDGALNYLPFEVLLTNDGDAALGKLPYLVRNYEISYTPSASVLANLNTTENATRKPDKTFLAFAAPDYGAKTTAPDAIAATRSVFGNSRAWSLSDLKNAGIEALRIAKLFPAGQSTVFTGAQATEERVKSTDLLNHYRYLHFAVHGLMDEEQPQFSSLVLSLPKTEVQAVNENPKSPIPNPQSEDGLLQTPEIFNLKLRADLVTLSACETGLGKAMRGEGIVGLTRAFFYAGTPSVLVSLWKVDDASTAELMTGFYESLRKNGGREKAAALREAQLKLIDGNRYAHPYYWAPFVLQGKSGTAVEKKLPAVGQ